VIIVEVSSYCLISLHGDKMTAVYVQVCGGCGVNIDAGRMAVVVSKATSDAGSKSTWHVACFRCCSCQQLLVDLCYCYKAGNVYCERDYAELIRPRCRACDEVSLTITCCL